MCSVVKKIELARFPDGCAGVLSVAAVWMQLRTLSAFRFVSVAAWPWVTSTVLPHAITAEGPRR